MGAWADRITAADFLKPPELAGLSLSADAAGRIGGVRIELLPAFRFGRDQPALLYLLNPTGGLLDGDGQGVELIARSGSRCVVVGQSATRIHPSLTGFSTQQWRIHVEAGAALAVLPGPAIP